MRARPPRRRDCGYRRAGTARPRDHASCPPQRVVQTAYGPRSSSILPRATATSCAPDRNSRGRYMAECSVEPSRYLSLTGPIDVQRFHGDALPLRGEVDDGQLAAVVDPAGAGRDPAGRVQGGRDDPPAGALPGVAQHVIGGEHERVGRGRDGTRRSGHQTARPEQLEVGERMRAGRRELGDAPRRPGRTEQRGLPRVRRFRVPRADRERRRGARASPA